jgi:hypothetical protein
MSSLAARDRQPSDPALPAVKDLLRLSHAPDHTSSEPFITALAFPRKALVIKAGLGRGKTFALTQHLRDHDYASVLIASPRRSFGRTMHQRLASGCSHMKFERYDTVKGALTAPYTICQAESFYRLPRESYDLLVLDEVESFLYQLTSTSTHKDRHTRNIQSFHTIMRQSSRILLMDAFLSDRTISLLQQLAVPFYFEHYDLPQPLRTCRRMDAVETFVSSLLGDLQAGKRIFLFCTSHTKLTESILPHLRSMLLGLTCLEYHGSSQQQLPAEEVNGIWSEVQLVAATSTITVGCNTICPTSSTESTSTHPP